MPTPPYADIRARFEMRSAEDVSGQEIDRKQMISAATAVRASPKLKPGLHPKFPT